MSSDADEDSNGATTGPMTHAQALSTLMLIENESETRASHLLRKAHRYWYYSFGSAALSVGLVVSTFYPLFWLNTSVNRVQRLRNPIKVKNANLYCLWANCIGVVLGVFTASPIGFRQSSFRMIKHASMYDALLWNAKVLSFQLDAGTFDGKAIFEARKQNLTRDVSGEWMEKTLLKRDASQGESQYEPNNEPAALSTPVSEPAAAAESTSPSSAAGPSDDKDAGDTTHLLSAAERSGLAGELPATLLKKDSSQLSDGEVLAFLVAEMTRRRDALSSIY